MLTQEILKKYVSYDPDTGHFTSNKCSKYCNKSLGERVGTLHKSKGYRYLTIEGRTYREQRAAFLYMTGNWPIQQVDHINGIKDDNRWVNLRDVDAATNCHNRGMYKNNKSGQRGVVWQKNTSKWQVLCRIRGVQYYKGLYENLDDAIDVAKAVYAEHHNRG